MPLRKDYILNRFTYISEERSDRPHQFEQKEGPRDHPGDCPFCPGQEDATPPEIGRREDSNDDWSIRWFKNKFAALSPKEEPKLEVDQSQFFVHGPAFGTQEVIVETPTHKQMADFDPEKIANIFEVYQKRIKDLSKRDNLDYVLVFKNKGEKAGASMVHSHSQVMAVGKTPSKIEKELKAFSRYDSCPYCEIIAQEKEGPRLVFENDSFVAFCPYAPKYNYEVWFMPKKHIRRLADLDRNQYLDLARLIKKVLKSLAKNNIPYCFYLQYAPGDKDFHLQIELLPRLNVHAGFELSGGDLVATVTPKEAAKFYRQNS